MIARRLGLDRFSGLYLGAVFILVFGLWTPKLFFTMATLHSVAAQQAIVGILALGLLIPMAAGAFDLSIGANINLCAVVVAVLQTQKGLGMWPAILIAICTGALVGFVNGFIVVKMGVSSFICTLGTATVVGAVQQIVSGGNQPFPPITTAWTQLTQRTVFGFQVVVLYLLVFAVIVWWFLDWTPAGRYMRAIGSNAEAARLSGVATGKWTWISLCMGGTLAGIAGVLYSSVAGPSLTFGSALLLPAFAAVYLGSTQLTPGRVNVWGTLIAIYVLATGVQGLQFVTSVSWLSPMFNGIALILAVSLAVERRRVVRRSATAGGPSDSSETDGSPPAGSQPQQATAKTG
jgi:ribose transport system permease protein